MQLSDAREPELVFTRSLSGHRAGLGRPGLGLTALPPGVRGTLADHLWMFCRTNDVANARDRAIARDRTLCKIWDPAKNELGKRNGSDRRSAPSIG